MSYVYKGAVYELAVREARPVEAVQIGSREFRDVIRSSVRSRNRSSGESTDFVVTYGSQGSLAGIPIQATYQPHWWLKLELQFDEHADVPPDPAANAEQAHRLSAVCQLENR